MVGRGSCLRERVFRSVVLGVRALVLLVGYTICSGEETGAPKPHAQMPSCPRPLVREPDLRQGLIPTSKDSGRGYLSSSGEVGLFGHILHMRNLEGQ